MNTNIQFPESLLNKIDEVHAEATAIFVNIEPKALGLIDYKGLPTTTKTSTVPKMK